jgi:6-phosphogluconolactonase (cycloisomerase 2 family)/glucose/arabinose dehydrogenase
MRILSALLALCCLAGPADAGGKKGLPTEDDYYPILRFPLPKEAVLEGGGLEFLPDGKLAVSTRRGEIWLVENALARDPRDAKFTRFAHGLHEVLGLAARDGWLYLTQRGEVSRIKSTKNNGKADVFETVCDRWEISGDYHEYAFGSRFDREGNLWVVLCLTGSFTSNCKYRGWCVRVTPDGELIPTCGGVRSPGGIGFNAEGDVFYTDNQGPWNGTCSLKHLKPGGFVGHPGGNDWYKLAPGLVKPAAPKTKSRLVTEGKRIPQLVLPPVLFPYNKMGQSASGIDCDLSAGKFGPFEKQLFVGDQTHSTVMRVFLEKVDGKYQGACFPFRQGFSCGIVPLRFAPDGSMFIGGTSRGWGSRGGKPYCLERVVWTGTTPFEIHEMRARHDGFELAFTKTVDPKTAADPASYAMKSYGYIYQADYGSPEVDHREPRIERVELGKDGKSVRLRVRGLMEGNVHELHAKGVRSADGLPLLHTEAYYTLNYLPPPDEYTVYVGTYTGPKSKGIYRLNLDLKTGALKPEGVTEGIVNPSFLALHPTKPYAYAVSEVSAGKEKAGSVSAFAIDPKTGALTLLNSQTSRGGLPCHLVVDQAGKNVLVANYAGGNVAVLPLGADGKLGEPTGFAQHSGKGSNPKRQQGPHAHSINLDAAGRFAFAADLGLDKVLVYRFDPAKGTIEPNDPSFADVEGGSGPRHFAFHPGGKHAYVINEMLSTVTAFSYDADKGALKSIQTISTLPAGFKGGNSTAEVVVHPSGRFLYGSNRGHDSMAVFTIDEATGKLTAAGHTPTQGKTPRNFAIEPTGQYLLAANQNSGTVVVLRIDPRTGALRPTGHSAEVPSPVCIRFLPR